MTDIHESTRDHIIQTGLACCRSAGDYEQLLLTARSFRYWPLRLELNDPGPVEEGLARSTAHDVVALRCAIRQDRRGLHEKRDEWAPLGGPVREGKGREPGPGYTR